MEFVFNKTVCKNLRKSLRKEWIETNALGSYASSSLVCCNTRKYHGLLVVKLDDPPGRYVLLSNIEDELHIEDREVSLSSRKHPEIYYPQGHEFLHEVSLGQIPTFTYKFGDLHISRQIMMLHKENVTLIRYNLQCVNCSDNCATLPQKLKLRVKPLLAFRNMHNLTHANIDLQVKTWPIDNGFCIRPYNSLPPLFMQSNAPYTFYPSPDWFYNVEYMIEATRGFANHEDLFQPGVMDMEIEQGKPIIICASTENVIKNLGNLEDLWNNELSRREAVNLSKNHLSPLERHLQLEGQRFIVNEYDNNQAIVAGYHWFESWGRDTCISLPGLTFESGESEQGWNILNRLASKANNGQIPNMFSSDGNHSYNCVDASLWFAFAAQTAFESSAKAPKYFREHCWPFIKEVVEKYASGSVPHVRMDNENFLHVGSAQTQLTWMDAVVNGKAVTPRYGCPVEINALWYNLLAFVRKVAKIYGEKKPHALCHQRVLDKMSSTFKERFWVEKNDVSYLADCWRPEGQDTSLRPNQLFAVGLPFPILNEKYWGDVVQTCHNSLLTPYGMRTLAPNDINYHTLYKGSPEERDGAYHQGTVWPWPLGIYCDALLKVAWDIDSATRELLDTISPLLTSHLTEVGIGTVSEIFMADPPYLADGCIAQAWSVAELIRLLSNLRKKAPKEVSKWEAENTQQVVNINF